MQRIKPSSPFICARCLRVRSTTIHHVSPTNGVRNASNKPASLQQHDDEQPSSSAPRQEEEEEQGAMSRRLSAMSAESVESGGRSAAKAVEEAGFSEDLKRELEEKIANASFRSANASAFAQANLPTSAGKGTRDTAAARPWTGTESTEDAALRMLNDAYKPLRTTPKIPSPRAGPPTKVDTGRSSKNTPGTGVRLANARDRSSMYSFMKDPGLSDKEKEKFRQELKARFQPAARTTTAPATIQGLASLANERIEDAIARGQFKNLPRGQAIERDHNANSPFIDTTEYLMNKIIQKQEIVPPWIEKQQELVASASKFRQRLRNDWRRHVARVISSRGGSGVEVWVGLAEAYARAERVGNSGVGRKEEERVNVVNGEGRVSQISLAGELRVVSNSPTSSEEVANAKDGEEVKLEHEIKIIEQTFSDDGTLKPPQAEESITISTAQPSATIPTTSDPAETETETTPSSPPHLSLSPFRDPTWQKTEHAYHTAAIASLNALTRSYNLMAPTIARKPYFYLDRELKACFADVAPQVAGTIRERAAAPPRRVEGMESMGRKVDGVLERFVGERRGVVYDERKPQYGFREFWRDLFVGGR